MSKWHCKKCGAVFADPTTTHGTSDAGPTTNYHCPHCGSMDLEECNIKMPSENDRYYVAVVNSERGSVDHTLHCTGMDALCILSGLCGQTIKALIRDCNLPESEAIRLIEAARLTGIDLWKSKKERNGLV